MCSGLFPWCVRKTTSDSAESSIQRMSSSRVRCLPGVAVYPPMSLCDNARPLNPPCNIPNTADFIPSCASQDTSWSPSHIRGVCRGVCDDALLE